MNNWFMAVSVFGIFLAVNASAGEQGHYAPAPLGVRDDVLPPKGFYAVPYNVYYHADKVKDSSGDKFDSIASSGSVTRYVNIGGQSVPVTITGALSIDLDFNVHSAVQQPAFLWVTDHQFLGGDYGFLVAPSWGYMSVNVAAQANAAGTISVGGISRSFSAGQEVKIKDDKTGLGDLMVRPLWLGWRGEQYDISCNYSAYLPIGAYDKDDIANVGMGFASQVLQASAYYYLTEDKATALLFKPTYEWNSKKYDKSVQPGQTMTIEYGISQYVHPRVEVAVKGYNQWQITDDSGNAATNKDIKDSVNGVGGQLTYWALKEKCAVSAVFVQEYGVKDRLEGMFGSLNVTWIF